MNIFTKENLSILFSFIALIISLYGLLINRRKFKLEKENIEREYKLGASKVANLLKIGYNLKNINPENLSYATFESDKKLFEEIFQEYEKNEVLISKTNNYFPTLIFNLKSEIEKIEKNFKGIKDSDSYTSEIELLRNYGQVFYKFAMFYVASNNENLKNIQEHFYKLYNSFENYRFKLIQTELQNKDS